MLQLVDLRKRYGDVAALAGVSLDVPPGSLVGFVGRNGAGKTTAMRVALGLTEPDAGEVRWQGRPIGEDVRRRIGYLPEERGLYPKMKVVDHLVYLGRLSGMTRHDAEAASTRWVERVGLGDRSSAKVDELSLGNQQRVQLAAAFVHGPPVAVLDEPFSGLDPVGVDVMAEALREAVADEVGCVFSSHQLELVERLCDQVVIIESGEVVASGAIAELRRRAAPRHLRVELEPPAGADGSWAARLPGVEVVRADGDAVVLALPEDGDEQAVLGQAMAVGRVRHFSLVTPTLSELFREVVRA